MLNIEADCLYAGALVLDGINLETISQVRRTVIPPDPAVSISFEPPEPHLPDRHTLVEPDRQFLLARVHRVAWRIHSRSRNSTTTHESCPIGGPGAVRSHWTFHQDWMVVDRLEEEHTIVTSRPISWEDLPGPGVPTQAPENGSRYYKLRGHPILATGDAARAALDRIADTHRRDHGPIDYDLAQRLLGEGDPANCPRCTRSPNDLMPMEVTIERTHRDVTLSDLPADWDYELNAAMAYERHVLMGTYTPERRGRAGWGIGNGDIVQFITGGDRANGYIKARARVVDSDAGNHPTTGIPQVTLAGLSGRPFSRAMSSCTRIHDPINTSRLIGESV
ncbi:hypothetical protein ACWDG9_16525 [Streptomyces sp. NPDC001073]